MCFPSLFKSAEQKSINTLLALRDELKQFDDVGEQSLAKLLNSFSKVLRHLIQHKYIHRNMTHAVINCVLLYSDGTKSQANDYDVHDIRLHYPRLKKQFDCIDKPRIFQVVNEISQHFSRLLKSMYQAKKDRRLQHNRLMILNT
jgi:hypothetical protein